MRSVLSPLRTRGRLRVRAAARLSGSAARGALVGALVAGILGMHAIASHGTSGAPLAAAAASPVTTSLTGADTASVDGHRAMDDGAAAPTSGHGPGHDAGAMVMLCVVMLAAAGLTLLILLALGPPRRLLPAAFRPAVVHTRPPPWVRAAGPPPAWQFSVIRC